MDQIQLSMKHPGIGIMRAISQDSGKRYPGYSKYVFAQPSRDSCVRMSHAALHTVCWSLERCETAVTCCDLEP